MAHRFTARATLPVVLLTALALAGCAPGGTSGGDENAAPATDTLTFWTPQVTPERLAAQEAALEGFTAETGIDVEVVPMAGADQDQALVTAAASGKVPDVILHTSTQNAAWRVQGLLDEDAAQEAFEELDPSTFNEHAVEALSLDGRLGAVPSDGWTHVIAYRADLLAQAGVEVPGSLAELAEAATAVKSALGKTGLAFGTQAGTASATEGIQSLFQSAGCELVSEGTVTIDFAECAEAAEHFKTLRDSSTAGDFDVTSARAAYMNGDAAMLLFSTHILDELAGLDEATPATCPECADDPAFLAENTEFITVLDEDHPAQFGAIFGYGIPTGAHAAEAQQLIEYLLSDGYMDTLGMATEGRFPLRNGTPDNPTEFVDAWGQLGIGPQHTKTASELYGDEFVSSMAEGAGAVYLWGMGTADAELAGLVSSQGVLSGQIEALYNGTSPEDVVTGMKTAVEEVQAGL